VEPADSIFKVGEILSYTEDGDGKFLRIVGKYSSYYMALHPRREPQ
jgi:hypothetical protein